MTALRCVLFLACVSAAHAATCYENQNCQHTPDCCGYGLKCYTFNAYSAHCLPKCDVYTNVGWECDIRTQPPAYTPTPPVYVTPTPPVYTPTPPVYTRTPPVYVPATPTPTAYPVPCPYMIGQWGGCLVSPHCCAAGMKCYRQSATWAACLPYCPSSYGWDCTVVNLSA